MSITAIKSVIEHSKHSGTAKLIMVCIANHYNDDYKCAWPSVARLVDYCNVSKQAVHKALSQLEKSGELIIQYKAGPNGNNKYTFNLPGLDSKDKLTVEEHNYTNDSKPEFTESKHNETTTVDSKPELTVNQSLPDSKLEFTETVNSSLPDPLITVNKPLSLSKDKGGKPPRTPKSKKSESSPTAPEAVMVYRSVTNRYPDKSTWAEIAGTVGGEPADLDFWREVVKAYIRCGWNKLNIDGMLKFYRDRRLPTTEKVSAQNGAKNNGHQPKQPSSYRPKSWAETQREKREAAGGRQDTRVFPAA